MKPYLLIVAALFAVSCTNGNPLLSMQPTALQSSGGVSHTQIFDEACGGPCAPIVGIPAPATPQPVNSPAPVVETPVEGPCGFVACPPPALNVPVASPVPSLPSPAQGATQEPQACPVFAFDDPTCPHYGPCGNVPCAAPVTH